MESEYKSIFENAKHDPSLFSTIVIDALLEKTENRSYLEGKTVADITRDMFDAINELGLTEDILNKCLKRLEEYRYVDRVCDLVNGRLTCWIKREQKPAVVRNGGILMNVNIEKNGVYILCRNFGSHFSKAKFDDCLIFQKMSMEEQLILMANEYLEKQK